MKHSCTPLRFVGHRVAVSLCFHALLTALSPVHAAPELMPPALLPMLPHEATMSLPATVGLSAEKTFGVPAGCDGDVRAVTQGDDNDFYLAGDFLVCGEVVASRVVGYDMAEGRFFALKQDGFPGTDGIVHSLLFNDGQLYVGGEFTTAGGQPAHNVAVWDGKNWSSLGPVPANNLNGPVYALGEFNGDIYVGGSFSRAATLNVRNIVRWRGAAWASVGGSVQQEGVNGTVYALAAGTSQLYVGGAFDTAGSRTANAVAAWTGSQWRSLGENVSNGVDGEVRALAASGSGVYLGGRFTKAGTVTAREVAFWDGGGWQSLGFNDTNGVVGFNGTRGTVLAITVREGVVYVAGDLSRGGIVPAENIASWNGSFWQPLSSGLAGGGDGVVYAIAATDQGLLAGGQFLTAGGRRANRVAEWDGSMWTALAADFGNGLNGDVLALVAFRGNIVAAGDFTDAGGRFVGSIAEWNGSSWIPLREAGTSAPGVSGTVRALEVFGDELYVAGDFRFAGGRPAGNIVSWNGSRWNYLGSGAGIGVNLPVFALAASADSLFAGGSFTQAGGANAFYLARWNGSGWAAVPRPFFSNGVILSLLFQDGVLYAGGSFSGIDLARNISRYDGSRWRPMGSGLGDIGSDYVTSIELYRGAIHAGGRFFRSGTRVVNHIARWDGSSWQPVGGGVSLSGEVSALEESGTLLVVGGKFDSSGGIAANGLASWDGSAWTGLGVDAPKQFSRSLLVDGGVVYAGGVGLTESPLPELLSASPSGSPGNGAGSLGRVNRGGTSFVFSSRASNLVAGSAPGFSGIYLRDTVTGRIRLISPSSDPNRAKVAEDFSEPSIGPVGSTVAYSGVASGQVFANFGGLGRTASTSRGGTPGNGESSRPMVPGSGSTVLLDTTSTNLLDTPDGNGPIRDIVAKDLNTGAVSLITVGPTGQPANGDSFGPWASEDGQTVAFWSLSTNLSDESVSSADASKMGTIKQVLVSIPGGMARSATYVSRNPITSALGNGDSINVRLTPDGRFGVFESVASNLVDDDNNGVSDIFRFEVEPVAGGRLRLVNLERVSLSRYGFQGNGPSYNASISDDGQFITFQTDATNLIELDRNDASDILVKWMVTKEVVRLSRTVDGEQPNGDSIEPTISGDGSTIVYGSAADNLTENDDNGVEDIFAVRIRESGDSPAIVTPLDEPTLQQVALPTPNPPNASCPAGFYIATVEDGPGTGVSNGAFGMELLLDQPGTRKLAGGLNFGGLVDVSQRGFAAVNIANAGNESQRLNVSLTGGMTPSGALPARVIIERRSGSTSVQVFQADVSLSGTPFETSIVVPPGFYVASVTPQGFAPEASGGEPEGRFLFSLTTSFLDRPGGSFQGGAVVGGYHASNPFGGSSGFASFCLATPHTVSAKVLSAPTYGERGARDLRLSVLDQARNEIAASPSGGGN